MHLMYFTEQPMSAYPADEGRKFGATALMFSNRHFDPVAGSRLYNEYLDQYRLAEDVGFDGIMLNEHHNAPFCMQAKCNVFASILAATTKKVKIVLLGNPLPLADNPVRLAEELAMIDMMSKGRLVSGFVRGGGQEQLAAGVNPAFNRERFEEAHELDRPRVDAAGAVPLRRRALPAPGGEPVGGAAPEAAPAGLDSRRAQQGDHRSGRRASATPTSRSARPSTRPRRSGSSTTRSPPRPATRPGPRTAAISSAATSPRPRRRRWRTRASSCGCRASSPGSPTRCGRARRGTSRPRTARRSSSTRWAAARIPAAPRSRTRSRTSRSSPARRRPSSRSCAGSSRRRARRSWASGTSDGFVSNDDTRTCIRLLGQEVLPAVREMGKELGLLSPFEADAPVSIAFAKGPAPVAA